MWNSQLWHAWCLSKGMESAFYKIKGDFCKFPSGWAEAGIWLLYHCVNFATSREFYIYADIQQWYVDVEMVCRSGGDNDPVLVTIPLERIPRIGSFLASFSGQLGQSSTNSQIVYGTAWCQWVWHYPDSAHWEALGCGGWVASPCDWPESRASL